MRQERDLTKLYSNAGESACIEEAVVSGNVPSFVNGTYLKVGPGKFDFDGGFSMNHFFDGYSSVAHFEINSGSRIRFHKKYLETDVYKRACKAGKPLVCEFGTGAQPDPSRGWLSRCIPQVIPEMSDNHNMTLYQLGSNVCVAGESCFFRDISQNKLELGEKHDTNKCYGLNFVSPHLLTDDQGVTYTVGSSFITGLKYNFVRIPPMSGKPSTKEILKKAEVFTSISSQVSTLLSMHHSFGMTSKYLVFIEQPYVLNVTKIFGGVLTKGQCFLDWMEWREELKNKFYLIDKKTGKTQKTEIVSDTPFMFTHLINCFENRGHVIIDLLKFDNGDFFEANKIKKILSNPPVRDTDYAAVHRFVIPPMENFNEFPENTELVKLKSCGASAVRQGKRIVCKSEQLTQKGLELPSINKLFISKPYKYFYCTGNTSPEGYFENSLVKMDVNNPIDCKIWKGSSECFPGEPVFIRNPEANEEDEDNGIVMSVVVTSNPAKKDYVLFLNAKTFSEVGKAEFSQKVPFLIHGLYLPKYM